MVNDQKTIEYYERNTESFFERSRVLDLSDAFSEFESIVPPGGRILDAGCGFGRDMKHFLGAGFKVTAFDASPALVAMARALTGAPVECNTFQEVALDGGYDGVWANASLLHIPTVEMATVLRKLIHMLRPGGVLYASFKQGTSEGTIEDGRFYNDFDKPKFRSVVKDVPEAKIHKMWTTKDPRPNRPHLSWFRVLLFKT